LTIYSSTYQGLSALEIEAHNQRRGLNYFSTLSVVEKKKKRTKRKREREREREGEGEREKERD
jgi:hypothetical protein